jgi:pimeloyl-ACP methyl ester carboxylesterase
MANKPSIVFAHGIWADGSCFNKVAQQLQGEGYECLYSQHGLDTVAGDVAMARRTIARAENPVVFVGHSYGGAVITYGGIDDRVAALVYIAALGMDETETSASEQEKFPTTKAFGEIEVADGRIWLKKTGIGYFCGDLPDAEQQLVWAAANPPAADLFSQTLEGIAWRSKPSWYIVANNDNAVHPDLERAAAARMGARTFDIDSSHVPMLSHPKFTVDVIRQAAESVR